MNDAPQSQPQQSFGQPVAPMPYVLEFDQGNQEAVIELLFYDQATGMVFKIQSIDVLDADKGDLTFP